MFKVQIEAKSVEFTFQHLHFGAEAVVPSATQCRLTVDGQAFSGVAACSKLDTFDKEKGRKLSLRRALKDANLAFPERTMVWSRYFNRDLTNAQWDRWASVGFAPDFSFDQIVDADQWVELGPVS